MDDKDNNEWKFRELYYSSLLQQRQENATNRIKIALISIGATIAGIIGTINEIQSLSILYLPWVILFAGYVPWICMLCILFIKLKIDVVVIDEKIATIGTDIEYEDTPKKPLADTLDSIFHWSLLACLIGIIFIPTYILITGDDKMSKKKTTQNTVTNTVIDREPIQTVVDRESTHEESYGGKPPGFMKPEQDKPKQDKPEQNPENK